MTQDELIKKIEDVALPVSEKDFQELIAATIDGGFMTEMEIARLIGCSRPSVNRWKMGMNFPMPGMRPLALRDIKEHIQKAT